MDNQSLVVFSTSLEEREHLRESLADRGAKVFCFSSETICFENLESIHPDLVIARIDVDALAWRFIFGLQARGAETSLVIVSNTLKSGMFRQPGLTVGVHCTPLNAYGSALFDAIQAIATKPVRTRDINNLLLVGNSEAMKQVRKDLPVLSRSRETILICGQEGTGKEHVSRIITGMGDPRQLFFKISCRDLCSPDEVPEKSIYDSSLFAEDVDRFPYRQMLTDRPLTILLDRVDALPKTVQPQLLFLLEEFPYRFAGGKRPTDIRYLATAETDLTPSNGNGGLRAELVHRLNGIPLRLPPLAERRDDIPLLVDYFTAEACIKNKKSFRIASKDTLASMYAYDWPGNLDELRTAVYRIALNGEEPLKFVLNRQQDRAADLNGDLYTQFRSFAVASIQDLRGSLPGRKVLPLKEVGRQFVAQIEKRLLYKALELTFWNRKKAADILDISYKSMLNKMKDYDIG
jgi:two-component system response regulator AtoC